MLATTTRLISVDDHITEPAHLWTDRLPERYRMTGPHVVELDDGRQAWAYEDQLVKIRRANALPRDGFKGDDGVMDEDGWNRFDAMRPGCYDPVARLVDMDAAGVWGQFGFPDFARFSGHRFLDGKDKELALLCVRAYNDFVFDEWCAAAPDRLFPLVIAPYWDLSAAVAEVERTAALGARAIALSENPAAFGLPSIYRRHWDPLWSALQDAQMPICMHIGSSGRAVKSSPDATDAAGLTMVGMTSMMACADWLFSGVLERFPGLRVVFSEGGAGWAPHIVERAMDCYEIYGPRSGATMPPDELFAKHVYVCMIKDDFALRSLGDLPVDNVLWEADYPHWSGTFPNSRRLFEAATVGVPDDQAAKIGELNARRLFRV